MATRDNLKEVRIGKGLMVSAQREHQLRNQPGGSNIGEYENIKESDFAGNACGIPGSYPINTIERARSALALAHNARDPECIRREVYKRYPELNRENR